MHKTTLLAILQQGEYDLPRLKKWAKNHTEETKQIEPTEWTTKLKLINFLSSLFFFLPQLAAIETAVWLTVPVEQIVRRLVYFRANLKLSRAKGNGLKVIAIAGSYAKTSTKHILFHTLSGSHKVLMTPKSINTLLGVAQVILKDLKSEHTILIVELGEYHRHDIAKLCNFIRPDFGILTPIGHQHLEILGSFKTVVAELSDLLAYFHFDAKKIVVSDMNTEYFETEKLNYYGVKENSSYRVTQAKVTKAGTEYSISLPENNSQPTELELFSPLFGEHQAINSLTSFWLADILGISREEIKKRISTLPYIHRRHEPTFAQNDVIVLDNSYNTNVDSIKESLKLLNDLKPAARFLITLGFTELGEDAEKMHYELGEYLADKVDYLGLIKAPWTEAIIKGFVAQGRNRKQVVIGETQEAAFAQLQPFVIPGSVILFEGGYQEVYI